jgi:hypothetical protein
MRGKTLIDKKERFNFLEGKVIYRVVVVDVVFIDREQDL